MILIFSSQQEVSSVIDLDNIYFSSSSFFTFFQRGFCWELLLLQYWYIFVISNLINSQKCRKSTFQVIIYQQNIKFLNFLLSKILIRFYLYFQKLCDFLIEIKAILNWQVIFLKYNLFLMEKLICFTLLVLLASSTHVLLNSDTSNTQVIDSKSATIALNYYHNQKNPNKLGTGAKWLWSNLYKNGRYVPCGATHTFYSTFKTSCPQKLATLKITADNEFHAYINGGDKDIHGKQIVGNCWNTVYTFEVKLNCGVNSLKVIVKNKHQNSPAAVVFSVIQDQSDCRNCGNSLGTYYNQDTCKCQCVSRCNDCGGKGLYKWHDYPQCTCACAEPLFCIAIKSFNKKTCQCECPKADCKPGQIQNQGTCQCQICQPQLCGFNPDYVWDKILCKCVFRPQTPVCKPQNCGINPDYVWDSVLCKCVFRPQIKPVEPTPKPLPLPYPEPYPLPYIQPCVLTTETKPICGSSVCSGNGCTICN